MKSCVILLLAWLLMVAAGCAPEEPAPGPSVERAGDSVPERAEVWLHVEDMTKVQGIT